MRAIFRMGYPNEILIRAIFRKGFPNEILIRIRMSQVSEWEARMGYPHEPGIRMGGPNGFLRFSRNPCGWLPETR